MKPSHTDILIPYQLHACSTQTLGLGRKGVYLYNLPEVVSAYKYMRVPSVSARFGTDPFFWNWAMWLTARLVPRDLLNNRDFVKSFAALSEPWVRAVDTWAGEAVVSIFLSRSLLCLHVVCTAAYIPYTQL